MNKEKRSRYNANWETVSQRIRLQRAGNRCERCYLKHGEIVKRLSGDMWRHASIEEIKAVQIFKDEYHANHFKTLKHFGLVQIVITVGHLNHNEKDDRDENLLAMCQRCHLMYDKQNNWQRKFLKSTQATLL